MLWRVIKFKSWKDAGILTAEVFLLCITIAIVYINVLLNSESISALSYLFVRDYFFSPDWHECAATAPYDPSIFLIHGVYEFVVLRGLALQKLPLWNEFSGCGFSMIGNIQGRIFAPLTWLLPISNQYLYNLRLLLELMAGAVGMALFTRSQGGVFLPTVLSGLAYAFCPFILYEFELPNQYWLYPWIFLAFCNLQFGSFVYKLLFFPCFLALCLYMSHPECMFFAISLASVGFLLGLPKFSKTRINQSTNGRLLSLTLAGIGVLCLFAPALLPFLEYIGNCYIYKEDFKSLSEFPLNLFLFSLAYPILGSGSLTIGPVAALLAGASILWNFRKMRSLVAVFILSTIFVTRPFPSNLVLSAAPFSYLHPLYCAPVAIVCALSIFSSGYKQLCLFIARRSLPQRRYLLLAAISLFLVGLLPTSALSLAPVPGMLHSVQEPPLQVRILSEMSILLFLLYLLAMKHLSKATSHLVVCISLLTSFGSVFFSPHSTIHAQAPFRLGLEKKSSDLAAQNERILSIGKNFFLPNTPSYFGFRDFAMFEALFTKRFYKYFQLAGARRQDAFFWYFDPPLNRLISLASVRYLFSQEPLYDPEDEKEYSVRVLEVEKPTFLASGLRLSSGFVSYNSTDRHFFSELNFKVHKLCDGKYESRITLVGSEGRQLSSSRWKRIEANADTTIAHSCPLSFLFAAPPGNQGKTVLIEVRDIWTKQPLSAGGSRLRTLLDSSTLSPACAEPINGKLPNLSLTYASPRGYRVYRNNKCYPQAYFVNIVQEVSDIESASISVGNQIRDSRYVDIVETGKKAAKGTLPAKTQQGPLLSSFFVRRKSSTEVLIEGCAPVEGWLIFTDSFYPGWKAFLNGKEVVVYPANILFRAVKLPAGRHQIYFKFEPDSFKCGLLCMGVYLSLSLTILLTNKLAKQLTVDKAPAKTCRRVDEARREP